MSHASNMPGSAGKAVPFTMAALALFAAVMVAVALFERRPESRTPSAVAPPDPPPAPAGIITYQIAGEGFFLARATGEPIGPAADEDLRGVADARSANSVLSPDGSRSVRIDRLPQGVWLAVGTPGQEVRFAQLAGPSDPALVDGGKGAAREVEGVPLVVAWSPDSRRLAYGSIAGEPWSLHLYAMAGTVPTSREFRVEGGYVGELAWSPDGKYLAISTYALDRSSHTVLLLDTTTNSLQRLSDGCHLTWSPDSRYLAIHRDPGVEHGAWVVSVDGETRFPISTAEAAYPYVWN